MITIHTIHNYPPVLKGNVRDLRVFWALEELALPYQIHWLDFAAGEHRAPQSRMLSPFGKVPALEEDGRTLFESASILLYLYDKAGQLPDNAFARAQINQWCFAALNTVEPVFFDIARWNVFWKDKAGQEWRYPELLGQAKERLADIERVLSGKTYLAHDTFSPADITMVHVLDFCRAIPVLFENCPNVMAWLERCRARPAYGRALALQGTGPQTTPA